ncbi:unnamed protein product (macronuclear) [Paramecium tetraurelia]|uniref:Uncharacterized protein n=1 Tax=Paramecium tetraurelia TaxID=5888 RepID=A0DMC3_PARTE|nr:uncharacterized protein GSPATT00018408001 [Paramecium tetraurelia]CAK84190.1 unnamed protein product [Paramecium tetraurelia]|eukprot:XP_001451587.1 hypothetical protein (macronuclear) [Paramecium tetraurelia strain d4-2]
MSYSSQQSIKLEDYREIAIDISQSLIAVRSIIREILRRSSVILIEKHLEQQIPLIMPKWTLQFSEDVVSLGIHEPDEMMTENINQGLVLETEPEIRIQDCWRSYIANIDLRFHQTTHTSHSVTKSHLSFNAGYQRSSVTVKRASQILKTQFEPFEPEFVNMQQKVEEDPFDQGLRLQLERDQQLRQQKWQAEQQRIAEKKEQLRQIRLLASSFTGDKKYTFDYEGKFMPQNIPQIEQLAPIRPRVSSMVQFQEKNKVIEFGKSFAHVKIEGDKPFLGSQINFQQKQQQNVFDQIEVAKGVTLTEGQNQKQGPSFSNKQNLQLWEEGLKLTKSEYQQYVQGIQGGVKIQKIIQNTSINDIEPSQVNLNTSIVNSTTVKEGSIRIDGNISVEELLITEEPTPIKIDVQQPLPKLLLKQKDLSQLLTITTDALKQGKPKLPKVMSSQHSLPQLPKNPRDRTISQLYKLK